MSTSEASPEPWHPSVPCGAPREALDAAGGPRIPNTIVLPPRSVPDEERWLSSWPELASAGPSEAWQRNWRLTVHGAYERFSDHWAAAVAYHF